MIATMVIINVKPEHIEDFKKITVYNHENSIKEAGNIRFDVLQSTAEPTRFTLYEVFQDKSAIDFHKTTQHYQKWRETVEPYMACPRQAIAHEPIAFT